jgi:hypothetical protein
LNLAVVTVVPEELSTCLRAIFHVFAPIWSSRIRLTKVPPVYLVVSGEGEAKSESASGPSILADALEALIMRLTWTPVLLKQDQPYADRLKTSKSTRTW